MTLSQPNSPDWVQSYGYDVGTERLTSIGSPSGSFGYGYKSDHPALVEKLSLPSGNWITNDYDTAARLTRTHLTGPTGVLTNKHEYTYNNGNQRIAQTRGDAISANDSAVSYAYDGMGELLTASGTESSGSVIRTNEQFSYSYDTSGNLSSKTAGVSASPNKWVQTFSVNEIGRASCRERVSLVV